MEKTWKYLFIVVSFIATASLFGNICLEYRLGKTRQQYNDVRTELEAARNQQQEIADIIRGTDEILGESFTTVEGIRSQVRVIRESYEKMEKLLSHNSTTNYSVNNNSDNTVEK
jgi:hypothetical protein